MVDLSLEKNLPLERAAELGSVGLMTKTPVNKKKITQQGIQRTTPLSP